MALSADKATIDRLAILEDDFKAACKIASLELQVEENPESDESGNPLIKITRIQFK